MNKEMKELLQVVATITVIVTFVVLSITLVINYHDEQMTKMGYHEVPSIPSHWEKDK